MIGVKVTDGLGNQMFQYAYGRSLALKNDVPLKLDLRFYDYDNYRKFHLDVFNVKYEVATNDELEKIANPWGTRKKRIRKLKNRIMISLGIHKRFKKTHVYENRIFLIDGRLKKVKPNTYVEGYFQSYGYMQGIEDELRNEFAFKDDPVGKNLELLRELKSKNSVSIHIRRGDYITNKLHKDFMGTCSVEYYNNAIKQVIENTEEVNFYVFGIGMDWAREKLDFKRRPVKFVTHNDEKNGFEDLRLMSNCKHNIIANSTFSWWGAWLNKNKEKMIFAPKIWLKEKANKVEKLIPNNWTKI